MLEFLRRHHKTFWIVVTAVIIISFTFWGATTKSGAGRGRDVDTAIVTVYGRDYDQAEISRLIRFQNLSYQVGMMDFAIGMERLASRFGFLGRNFPLDFAVNLIVLREQMDKYGIKVSDAEANEAFRNLPTFRTKEGEFNGALAKQFEDQILGPMGFHAEDMFDMMRDYVGFRKLQKLVSGNVTENPAISEKSYAERFQSIRAQNIPFAAEDFKKKAQVSDEEISKYFEQNKDKFATEPMRAFSYVFFEQPKDLDKVSAEERLKKQNEAAERVNKFSSETISDPKKFDDLAKDMKLEVHKVPAFAESSPPEALKDEFTLIADVFKNDRATHPVSDAVQGKDGYYIYKVDDVQNPKPQELKDVKDKIKDTLLAQKAQENMMKEASDVRKKLEDAVKAGKKFADAAKEAGVQPQPITEFMPSLPPSDLSNGDKIAQEAQKTPAGGITKPIPAEHGVILVYVESKTLYKSDESAQRKLALGKRDDAQLEAQIFQIWFEKRRDEANAKPHLNLGKDGG